MKAWFRSIVIGTVSLACATGLHAETLYWNVGGGGAWDTSTANWTNAAGASLAYVEGDTVHFENSAGGLITLNVNHSPGAVFVSAPSGTNTFTNASITGSCKLTKSGGGELDLGAANTFTGGIDISQGTIDVGNNLNSLGGQAVAGANIIHFTGDATISMRWPYPGGGGGYTYDPIVIDGGVTATLAKTAAPSLFLYGNISGAGGVTVVGNSGNYFALYGSNTFTGDLVAKGQAGIKDDFSFGGPGNTLILDGGYFVNLTAATITRTITLKPGSGGGISGGNWTGLITGTGTTFAPQNTYLLNTNNNFMCTTYIFMNTGRLQFDYPGALNGNYILLQNGTLSDVKISGPSAVYTNKLNFYNGTYMTVDQTSSVIDWNGSVIQSGTPIGMTKRGPGTLNLNANSPSFVGGVNIQAGRLNLNFTTPNLPGITISNGASLGGTGTNNITGGGAIAGDGSIDPGNNSAGIMTSAAVDPNSATGTLDFSFQLGAVGSPDYTNPAASSNAVLRLTGAAPFSGDTMTSSNVVSVYLSGSVGYGRYICRGGFYTDAGDFQTSFSGASFRCFVPAVGGPFTHNGQQYDWMTNVYRYGSMTVRTVNETGTQFGGIDGYVTEFKVLLPAYLGTVIVVQ